ncbi:hypothetical protein Aduo_018701 [Ancylostoma duodenale]
MTMRLSGKQAWLTRMGSAAEEILQKYSDLRTTPSSTISDPDFLGKILHGYKEMETKMKALAKALDSFTVDTLAQPLTTEQQEKVLHNVSVAQELLDKTQNRSIELAVLIDQD